MTRAEDPAPDTEPALRAWRKQIRDELVARRLALTPDAVAQARAAIEVNLEAAFDDLARGTIAFCWPIRNELDVRPLLARLRKAGAITALPVVVAPRQPLIFRQWRPGIALTNGPLDIPYPATSPEVVPDTVLVPMNGFDRAGYRLGYGAGFFDRTLAAMPIKPRVIGLAYAFAELPTIHPQPYDIPMDFVVTEAGVFRREGSMLVAHHKNRR